MATLAELTNLRDRIAAIIAHHGSTTHRVTEGMLKGATSPSGALTYLTVDEYDMCINSGYLQRYSPPSVSNSKNQLGTAPGGGGGQSQS